MSVTTWRYHLRSEKLEGWLVAFLDSNGCFAVLSDYGNYGYRWPAQGWGPGDFRAFFIGCDDGYILRKIAQRDVYDGPETVREIKRTIIEARRNGPWSKERARREWDLLESSSDVEEHEVGFHDWYQRTSIEDAYELSCYSPPRDATMFVERALPRLRAAIRAELAQEAA